VLNGRGRKLWIYTSTPPYFFMTKCSVKQKDSFSRTDVNIDGVGIEDLEAYRVVSC
jgi:hypothetical protein